MTTTIEFNPAKDFREQVKKITDLEDSPYMQFHTAMKSGDWVFSVQGSRGQHCQPLENLGFRKYTSYEVLLENVKSGSEMITVGGTRYRSGEVYGKVSPERVMALLKKAYRLGRGEVDEPL
mgnify:CR=1 FL=1